MIDIDITEKNVRILVTEVDPNKELCPSILSVLPFEEGDKHPGKDHVVSAAKLPEIRSRNKKFWDAQAEKGYKEVYGGNMVMVTRIEKFDIPRTSRNIEFGAFRHMFIENVSQALMVGGFEEVHRIGVPVIVSGSLSEKDLGLLDTSDGMDNFFRLLTEDQREHLTLRVEHL